MHAELFQASTIKQSEIYHKHELKCFDVKPAIHSIAFLFTFKRKMPTFLHFQEYFATTHFLNVAIACKYNYVKKHVNNHAWLAELHKTKIRI